MPSTTPLHQMSDAALRMRMYILAIVCADRRKSPKSDSDMWSKDLDDAVEEFKRRGEPTE